VDSDPRVPERDLPTSASGEPTLVFDVVNELGEAGRNPDPFTFCYANEGLSAQVKADTYANRAEGRGRQRVRHLRRKRDSGGYARPRRRRMDCARRELVRVHRGMAACEGGFLYEAAEVAANLPKLTRSRDR
jgi:hypothetical protein